MSAARSLQKSSTAAARAARAARWKRVGLFVRERREALGLSQGQVGRSLGYGTATSVSQIELGLEGVPAKRAYAWADVLEVSRDAFYRMVTGEDDAAEPSPNEVTARLTGPEEELLASYRRLPAADRQRLREHAAKLASAKKPGG